MQMDERLLEELGIGAERPGLAHHIAIGDLRRLLHHISELAGELESPVEDMGSDRLHTEGGAAHGGPGQTRDDTGARACELVYVEQVRAVF